MIAHRRRPHVRAAARRDRPVGGLHRRRLRRLRWRGSGSTTAVRRGSRSRSASDRRRDRRPHRLARREGGHPLVRRDAGLLPRVAGRGPVDREGGRHDRRQQRADHRHRQQEPEPALGWVLWAIVVVGYLAMAHLARRPAPAPASRASRSARSSIKAVVPRRRLGHRHVLPQREPLRSPARKQAARACRSPSRSSSSWSSCSPACSRARRWGRAHLRRRRQRRGGAPRRHQRALRADVLLHHVLRRGCLGGMALASQLSSVSPQTGGNDTLLLAVGAAASAASASSAAAASSLTRSSAASSSRRSTTASA